MFNGLDLSTISDCRVGNTPAQAIYFGNVKIWPSNAYAQKYFTIVSLDNNNEITFVGDLAATSLTISVSTDDGQTWTQKSLSANNTTSLATLNNGDKLLIKGSNSSYLYYHLSAQQTFNIEGNIMSLIYGDSFINQTTFTDNDVFHTLLLESHVISAENLILPATTLTAGCYAGMFYGCTSLTTAPELPATTLAVNCYTDMFYACSFLTTPPALPATTLRDYCYHGMFSYSALTTAPTLPATTLADYCYGHMFESCLDLTTAPALPATTLTNYCYDSMFCGCSSLTTAPELTATTLAYGCYQYMFEGCTVLNYVKCLATDISAQYCTDSWLNDVSATGTFVKDANMNDWTTGTSGIPSGWTVQNV